MDDESGESIEEEMKICLKSTVAKYSKNVNQNVIKYLTHCILRTVVLQYM